MEKEKQEVAINGKVYRLWNQFIERKSEYVGGILMDGGDSFDSLLDLPPDNEGTIIKDIKLEPNGADSAYFSVVGERYSCGFDVQVGGLAVGQEGWTTFSGYGGHEWRIKKPETKKGDTE